MHAKSYSGSSGVEGGAGIHCFRMRSKSRQFATAESENPKRNQNTLLSSR